MSTTDHAKQALAKVAAPKEQRTILQLVEAQKPAIERVLPASVGVERFTRIALTELRRNPKLLDCNPESVLGSLMLVAQLGLEPGPLGLAYLVPFGRECTLIIGYTGLINLAYRSGELKSIVAVPVYEQETFRVLGGSQAKIVHEMESPSERGDAVKAYYSLAKLKTGGEVWKVLYPDEIEAHRKRSPAANASSSPWKTDYTAMALKTCVRVLRPWLPLSATFSRAVEVDEQAVRWDSSDVEVVEAVGEEASDDAE